MTELNCKEENSFFSWQYRDIKLCDDISKQEVATAGKLSFIESISVLDNRPKILISTEPLFSTTTVKNSTETAGELSV